MTNLSMRDDQIISSNISFDDTSMTDSGVGDDRNTTFNSDGNMTDLRLADDGFGRFSENDPKQA